MRSAIRSTPRPTTRSIRTSSRTRRWSSGYWRWSSPRRGGTDAAGSVPPRGAGRAELPITIGAGLIERADELLAPLLPLRRTVIVTDENLARTAHPARLAAALERAGIASRTLVLPAGESTKSWPLPRAAGRRAPGPRRRAALGRGRAGRRGDRRSGRLRRRRDAARHRLHPDPDHAPGPGRQCRRRQDRHQHAPRQEPDRCLPPAARRC